jgi:hypothetical protein
MAFARLGIVPAQGMEPTSDVHLAAFAHVLGAELRQGAPSDTPAPFVVSCTCPSATFQRMLVSTLNVVRAVPVAVYVTAGSSQDGRCVVRDSNPSW